MRLAVICLAAGYSRRFPENKLLYPLSGKPLFAWGLEALETFARRCGGTVYTVTQYPQIIRYCEKKGLPYALNCPDTNTGKASSIKMGLETAKDCWDCYLFQVADQPWIDPDILERFWMEYQSSGKGIGCVCDRMGEIKNPVIFSCSYRNLLLELQGDEGGRKILEQFPEDVWKFPVNKEHFFYDIDTKGDLPDE
ncbi:MAG TPA: nucleotidyltransferase family protein [Candidatus Eubacterium avistercoris]|uniref:Nucleotidyltransferase family protein n=1 Tax=Candidatus Eubacterium avistercoris TaxID=2838567 RepID=A0A9D2D361_9FIRM|nr:nucleotidyltransferase family protein [Candidatus Eubacterium avistercoris]